jgi:hypothetical protein
MQEKPQIEIKLIKPGKVILLYGVIQKADRIVLDADDPQAFIQELQTRLTQ